ncbi:amino acid ABC transporter permease [Salipaludibacillus agaradhaerens]|uniref:amino acid ABC transporter permease n=1 Tax=Salipaludibacillus agaradhaerens TaxID=76935 RepID=UPI00215071C6|nr:amino acid ABC transporter permease [Salipaludibacillus agaradhaerens]MCR6105241.1 amino acid ABC transporter permease [Salipaludibacillus agaradhaerens]MCR6117285.1 amino acid ABC transporter permease [Salipaludibacillus agaradhaerens]UJW56494.1 amino acid ABC transporter permease [Bacillus sp. A116_S68]
MRDIQWEYIFNVELATDSFLFIMEGIGYTMLISLSSMLIGIVISLFLALGRMSSLIWLQWPSRLYISFMRGVPILVILFILYFGFPFIGIEFNAVTAAIIGFSLNSAAYMAEINRSAIGAVPKGQWESAKSLGFSFWPMLQLIVLPQATRIAIPPLTNVLLDLIKASSLAAMITVPEIFQQARIIGGREMDYMTMYILVALIYWGICSIMTIFQNYLENRYKKYGEI